MTPSERVVYIVENCTGGSQKKFSEATDISMPVASRLRAGLLGNSEKEGIGRFAERIYRAFPELNAAWLLTGEGEPFASTRMNRGILARIEALEQAMKELRSEVYREKNENQ